MPQSKMSLRHVKCSAMVRKRHIIIYVMSVRKWHICLSNLTYVMYMYVSITIFQHPHIVN